MFGGTGYHQYEQQHSSGHLNGDASNSIYITLNFYKIMVKKTEMVLMVDKHKWMEAKMVKEIRWKMEVKEYKVVKSKGQPV